MRQQNLTPMLRKLTAEQLVGSSLQAVEVEVVVAASSGPELSKYACFCLLRPNGNAAPERLMSLLTAMDKPEARTTKAHTLSQVLFLRGNAEIVRFCCTGGHWREPVALIRVAVVFWVAGGLMVVTTRDCS